MKTKKWCFSGCALHVFYQLGVVFVLLCEKIKIDQLVCTSAGMASALYYLLDLRKVLPLKMLLNTLPICSRKKQIPSTCMAILKGVCFGTYEKNVLEKARNNMLNLLCETLRKHRPHAYKEVSGKLFVTVCEWPSLRVHVKNCWNSNEELLQWLCLTTTIPFVTSYHPCYYKGKYYVDGGFKDSHPVFDCNTVVVSNTKFGLLSCAYRSKGYRCPEIGRSLCDDSSYLVRSRAYYRQLFKWGKEDASSFLNE